MKIYISTFCRLSILIMLLNVTLSVVIYGQEKDTLTLNRSNITQKDLGDIIRVALNKPPKAKTESEGSLLLLPIIGSNPATGFMLGVGGQYAFMVPGSSLYSAFMGSVQVTTKAQMLILLKNNVYTKNNRYFFSGDWRFQIFSQDTWGLGTNSPEGGIIDYQYNMFGMQTTMDSLAQPMKFNFARFHQSVSLKITDGFYAGLGYQLDSYFKIVDEKLRLNPGDTLITSHYAYNDKYAFRKDQYVNSALNINLIYDTRDNMINPYKGVYAVVSWRGGMKLLGNKDNTNTFNCEWRSFHGLSKANPRHLVAFWLFGNFSKPGELPYMILPASSYDQRSRSARGYTQGRYRGNNFVYGEAEYRFPISKPGGVLGGVIFANATSTNNVAQDLKLFESVRPGYGIGLRIMAQKNSRTNLAIDYGFGHRSSGFYLAASEVF